MAIYAGKGIQAGGSSGSNESGGGSGGGDNAGVRTKSTKIIDPTADVTYKAEVSGLDMEILYIHLNENFQNVYIDISNMRSVEMSDAYKLTIYTYAENTENTFGRVKLVCKNAQTGDDEYVYSNGRKTTNVSLPVNNDYMSGIEILNSVYDFPIISKIST